MIMPEGCSLPDGSATSPELSARRAHHLQNPQNRPWYRFVTGSLIGPFAGFGESGTSRMEAE